MKGLIVAGSLVIALCIASSAYAHHSAAGIDTTKTVTTEGIVNERVLAWDLVGKVGVRHVPCLRTSLVGRVALEIPFFTFTVVPRLHSFNTCLLSK